MTEEILSTIKIVIVTFFCSALIMPIMKRIATHVDAIDRPRDAEGHRHIHKQPTPFFGGLGIFLSFLLGYMMFGTQSVQMNSILIGSFIVILTGLIDDIKPIKAWQKFTGHIIAALVIALYGHITLNNVTAFGFSLDFGILTYPITVLFIVACTNIINLIDGLDGLSGGVCSIFFLTIGIIGLYQGRVGSLVMILTFIMLGATLGFLLHNFYPATIFMGDCSTFVGFIISIISILEFKGPALTSFFVPLAILAIPILDTLFAIIRRSLKKKPVFSADKEHFHHQLLGMNFSQRTTVLIIYAIDILFSISTILYTVKNAKVGQIIYIILFIAIVWFVLHTSIISEKSPQIAKKIINKIKPSPLTTKKKKDYNNTEHTVKSAKKGKATAKKKK